MNSNVIDPDVESPADNRPANPARKRFLKQALAAVGLAAVGMKSVGERTAQAATVFGDAVTGRGPFGLRVRNTSSNANVAAIRGELTSTTSGVSAAAVVGTNAGTNTTGIGVFGTHDGSGVGVRGSSRHGRGIVGQSSGFEGIEVQGVANGGGATGVHGTSTSGLGGLFESDEMSGATGIGSIIGLTGFNTLTNNRGYIGTRFEGVFGTTDGNGGYGVYATTASGGAAGLRAVGTGNTPTATFGGNVEINGYVSATGGKYFVIDHPLDPANQLLVHAAIESHEMLNEYTGNVVLDANGTASVELPVWFEALNRDLRYGLTAIGAPAQNLHISEEVSENHFRIAGGPSGCKVSWRVTGLRSDAWALANPMQVERVKPDGERGTYLQPEAHGLAAEQGHDAALMRARSATADE